MTLPELLLAVEREGIKVTRTALEGGCVVLYIQSNKIRPDAQERNLIVPGTVLTNPEQFEAACISQLGFWPDLGVHGAAIASKDWRTLVNHWLTLPNYE